jgi:hypothetical protein
MSARPPLALVVIAVAFAAALYAPAFGSGSMPAAAPVSSPAVQSQPQSSPVPLPPLTPLSLDFTPDPSSTGPYPRLLGHVVTSASCTRFVEHYNVAAAIITSNDTRISTVDTTLNSIADDYYRRDGALRAYEHRLQLIDNVSQMQNSIPVEQRAVNDMLAQAKETNNPARQAALQESASQLQKTVDRQRAVAYDLSNVVHVLMDKHGSEDTMSVRIQATLLPGETFTSHPGDDPVPQPGDGPIVQSAPSKNQTTAQDVMQYDRQKRIIAAAETKAASAASRVVTTCHQNSDGTPPDQTQPNPNPSP